MKEIFDPAVGDSQEWQLVGHLFCFPYERDWNFSQSIGQ
jgi:hypothetical protein